MKRFFPGYLELLFLVMSIAYNADARSKSPLMDDEGGRTKNKAAECVFGKQVRELGSQWVPDLGVPIGVLYCMKCECVPFRKKRRIVARVQCRSIKKECPVPSCEEPVLLPGRCCKICPGDNYNPDVIQDVVPQNTVEEEERSSKHFAALLSGRSSLILKNDDMQLMPNDQNKNNVVATGRFTFQKKNLYYSFYISDKAARPRSLQFVDGEGTILEEHTLSGVGGLVNSLYQNATRKVCGVWRRLPRDYRRLLKEERMFAVLVWGVKDQAEFTLSGQIMKYVALGTELFSSLLEPAPGSNSLMMSGAGGTAIVSASTTVSPSIHIAVVFNGIFLPDEILDVPVTINLSLDEKKQVILEEKIRVQKPARELNVIEVSSPVSPADLRLLTRGRLVLSVSSVSKPQVLRLSGNVITKATCELFQTTLNSAPNDRAVNLPGSSGLAWLFLNNEGSLVYSVQVEDLIEEQKPIFITLVDVTTKRKMELEDLTPDFVDGWANGTVDKLSPRVLEPLYSGNLAVNVASQSENNLLRGRLVARLVADARDAPAPMLLKRVDKTLPPSAVGISWITVDNYCHMHYDITLSGMGLTDKKYQLSLDLLPMIAPGAPVITHILDEFNGNQVEGSPTETLPKEELVRLDAGVVFINIKEKTTKTTLLSATLRELQVPATCLSHITDNNVPTLSLDSDVAENGACFHERKFYQEGDQWTTSDPCTMCYCQNGNAKCDTSACPEIVCPTSFKIKVPGECCPICSNSTTSQESNTSAPRGCTFGGMFYTAGSRFHPFLIPNGFDLCTECHCDSTLLEVKCTRQSNEKKCCKHCVDTSKAMIDSENGTYVSDLSTTHVVVSKDAQSIVSYKTPQQVLSEGGCKNPSNPNKPYENGQKYHPWIASLGEYKCVTCKCKNGSQSCERQRCTRAICHKMFKPRHNGMQSTTNEFCCSQQQCKHFRRHHRARNS
ncbi:hypothetical protein PPYR_11866 [Photinus pyralis]|uniref:Short gastrulation n=3 Tax=Photinus pyralis TaxID=7054 RepID=A0A1Y1M0P1_PHOPY|nr:dorsal-ventral patterning protein Sog isoform X1 [Photinus pyralis]KAB0795027.1 hypothetical protein PPYR_11866 [Photinus pyralis]